MINSGFFSKVLQILKEMLPCPIISLAPGLWKDERPDGTARYTFIIYLGGLTPDTFDRLPSILKSDFLAAHGLAIRCVRSHVHELMNSRMLRLATLTFVELPIIPSFFSPQQPFDTVSPPLMIDPWQVRVELNIFYALVGGIDWDQFAQELQPLLFLPQGLGTAQTG